MFHVFFTKQQSAIFFFVVILMILEKLHETQGLQTKFHDIKYINLIYIYLLSLYNSSILDIEHSPYHIALGSPQTHKAI